VGVGVVYVGGGYLPVDLEKWLDVERGLDVDVQYLGAGCHGLYEGLYEGLCEGVQGGGALVSRCRLVDSLVVRRDSLDSSFEKRSSISERKAGVFVISFLKHFLSILMMFRSFWMSSRRLMISCKQQFEFVWMLGV